MVFTCERCNGKGYFNRPIGFETPNDKIDTRPAPICKECDGTGKIYAKCITFEGSCLLERMAGKIDLFEKNFERVQEENMNLRAHINELQTRIYYLKHR